MKPRIIYISILVFTLVLTACAPLVVASSSGEQPAPAVETIPVAGYQPVTVDQVDVKLGVGSPIPVHVHVSGTLPDICSQIEHTEIRQDGRSFIVTLSATPLQEGCVRDTLPFRISIPLNIVDLPAGSYSVMVNGSVTDFTLETGGSTTALRTAEMPIAKNDIQVDSVNMEVGVGSPIPVHAIVSGNLPAACAQVGEVRVHRDGTTFFVRLVAYLPAQTDCREDLIPFRLEVPLNIVNMPEGPYVVSVNGVTASFEPFAAPEEQEEERKPIQVEHVGVQVGQGSPIPVEIVASGTWPDLCAQIAEVKNEVRGFEIDVTVLASTTDSCPPDHLGLPFRYAFPLNIVELEAGTYTITVNGTSTTLDLPVGP